MENDDYYQKKYIKYKNKYLSLKGASYNMQYINNYKKTIIEQIQDILQYIFKNNLNINVSLYKNLLEILNATIINNSKLEQSINSLISIQHTNTFVKSYTSIIINNSKRLLTLLLTSNKHEQYTSAPKQQIVRQQPAQQQIVRQQPAQQQKQLQQYKPPTLPKVKFIGEGGFGCILCPPIELSKDKQEDFKIKDFSFDKYYTCDYIAKVLQIDNNVYKDEYESLKLIHDFDPNGDYTPQFIYAAQMNKQDMLNQIQQYKNIELYNCFYKKLKQSALQKFGYIISTNVGSSFDKIPKISDTNTIKTILKSFNLGIRNFITILYNNNYIHGDIKHQNITLKDNKVYFIDFGFCTNISNKGIINDKVYGYSVNFHYSYASFIIAAFNQMYMGRSFTILDFMKEFNSFVKNDLFTRTPYYQYFNNIQFMLNEIRQYVFNNMNIHQYYYLQKDNILRNLDYVYKSNNLQNDSRIYNTATLMNLFFKSEIKKTDIYSLSIFLYMLFISEPFRQQKKPILSNINRLTINKVISLIQKCHFNQIDNPTQLADMIDDIIISI